LELCEYFCPLSLHPLKLKSSTRQPLFWTHKVEPYVAPRFLPNNFKMASADILATHVK